MLNPPKERVCILGTYDDSKGERDTERDTERERERERSVFTETREEKYKKYAKHTQNKREMGESEIAQFVVIVS